MGVGHHTTDEVGLGLVEGGHQVVQLALEVGGHGLAALALLPVLILGSLQGLERESGVNLFAFLLFFNMGAICITGQFKKIARGELKWLLQLYSYS